MKAGAWLLGALLCGAAVLLCMAYVDRPVADWVQAEVRPSALYDWIMRGFAPLRVVAVLAVLFLFGSGRWALVDRPLPSWTRTPLLASWSGVWALAATLVFKEIFGRSAPDPEYVVQHVYGYHLPESSLRYAFPSGTTTMATALLTVLWIRMPRLRFGYLAAGLLLGVALIISNSHWVSDVIAGAFLGASIGWMTVQLARPEILH